MKTNVLKHKLRGGLMAVLAAVAFQVNAQSIADIVIASEDHDTLEAAVVAAGLATTLDEDGPFTVFAPTDAAFATLPDGTLDALLADPTGSLADILLYHVAPGTANAADLSDGMRVTTVNGDSIYIKIDGTDVYIDNAMVTTADITADNGVVHVIDAVILPANTIWDVINSSAVHETLETAVKLAKLDDELSGPGTFTVFAPTDDAFTALPHGVLDDLIADPEGALAQTLLYHVAGIAAESGDLSDGQYVTALSGQSIKISVSGSDVMINDANVSIADIVTENGVVHVIDAVIQPGTVVDIIVGSAAHDTLEAAVTAAGLVPTLQGDGPFTVFAPTDDAFAALPAGTIEALLGNIPALTAILTYHVAGVNALSTDLSDGMYVTTLNGDSVKVRIMEDMVMIDRAMVTLADIVGTNGVVHVIDAVVLPEYSVYDVIAGSADHNTLEAAINAAGLDNTLNFDGPFTVFAPTDAAFAALGDAVNDLLADPQGALTDILLYHVLGDSVRSTSLSDGMMATTLNGDSIMVRIEGSDVFIDSAKVTVTDIEADNGLVHVIDAVIVPYSTVVDVIVGSPDHTTLEAAVVAAGLVETLSGEGPFTVFAPTDAAFANLPPGTVEALLNDIPTLTAILTYHVVGDRALSTDLMDGDYITTLNGDSVKVRMMEDKVMIDRAEVTMKDIETNNGVVHVIDAVILPEYTVYDVIAGSADHNTLEAAINAAGLDNTLNFEGPFTVFAPTDDAFAALGDVVNDLLGDPEGALTDILLYHVLGDSVRSTMLSDGMMATTLNGDSITVRFEGDDVYIDSAKVVIKDIEADNGLVHVIDAVIVPYISVMDIITASADHNTLQAAIEAAGLAETLSANGTYTVFAPTDAAFAELPEGMVEDLLADPTGDLTQILLYHVLGTKAMSSELTNGQMVTTLQGSDVEITIDGSNVYVNGAKVVQADIETDNGVVHVIDAVITPATDVTDRFIEDLNVRLYPNPASEFLNVSYQVAKPAEISLDMFSIMGQKVRTIQKGYTSEGVYTDEIAVDDLESGVYIIIVNTGNEKVANKVRVVN